MIQRPELSMSMFASKEDFLEATAEPEEHFDPQTGILHTMDDLSQLRCLGCRTTNLTYGEWIYVGICKNCATTQWSAFQL